MLEEILIDARRRAGEAVTRDGEFRATAASQTPARGFAAALRMPGPAVVAEIKRRSPSRGLLAPGLDAQAQAKRYASGGAAAISVLTDPDHFDGSLADLAATAEAVDLPVLRKDFLVEPAQVWESRAAGADAVLLIVAVLGRVGLTPMLDAVTEAGIDALVEVHDEAEVAAALDAGATLIGVNNRDLTSFVTDISIAERLAPHFGESDVVTVAESGVSDPSAAAAMWAYGYDAILVGEALVTAPEPEGLLRALVAS
jgi:indole-3-glycerol phosphate synthase